MYVCMEMHIYRYVFAIRHLGSYITLNICLYMTGCFIIFRRYLIHQLPFKWHYIKHQRRICVCACVHIPCFAKLVMRSFGFLESEHAKNIHVHTPGLPQLYFRFSFSDRWVYLQEWLWRHGRWSCLLGRWKHAGDTAESAAARGAILQK